MVAGCGDRCTPDGVGIQRFERNACRTVDAKGNFIGRRGEANAQELALVRAQDKPDGLVRIDDADAGRGSLARVDGDALGSGRCR